MNHNNKEMADLYFHLYTGCIKYKKEKEKEFERVNHKNSNLNINTIQKKSIDCDVYYNHFTKYTNKYIENKIE